MNASMNKIIRYVLMGVVLLIVLALLWWFFFLRGAQEKIEATDAARGKTENTPAFRNAVGSTYENVAGNSGFGGIIASLPLLSDSSAGTSTAALPRLSQVTKTPVAGSAFVETRREGSTTTTIIRFVERGTGYILEANPATGALTRITNTLVPRIYEALVGKDGIVVLRSLDEGGQVVTAIGRATSTSSNGGELSSLSMAPLPQNIRSIAIRPDNSLIYVVPTNEGAAVMRQEEGKEATRIAALGVSEWQVRPFLDATLLTQHPTSNAMNYVYVLEDEGVLRKIMPPARDLFVLPKENSSALLYSTGFSLYGRIGATTSTVVLPVRTSAEKCVWAPGVALTAYCAVPQTLPGFSLDTWRRGEAYTRDAWWRIDVSAGQAEELYSPENATIDVESPGIDLSGSYIVFMNRIDKSLWSLRIAE